MPTLNEEHREAAQNYGVLIGDIKEGSLLTITKYRVPLFTTTVEVDSEGSKWHDSQPTGRITAPMLIGCPFVVRAITDDLLLVSLYLTGAAVLIRPSEVVLSRITKRWANAWKNLDDRLATHLMEFHYNA
jgi:hypothetical protein